ncbi:expressed unknown protein [Seminavis robusta]|uniref:PDZ domain-containing protein n=1 Tax=Seminavis robusta TaxID=568900 RepID=A0A9N8EAY8_9STRA|nr:expressed unknown protein [Seminavis robusta]|eukprot:Sro820_g207190.1 n/a (242) ;mRNA; r:10066-10791
MIEFQSEEACFTFPSKELARGNRKRTKRSSQNQISTKQATTTATRMNPMLSFNPHVYQENNYMNCETTSLSTCTPSIRIVKEDPETSIRTSLTTTPSMTTVTTTATRGQPRTVVCERFGLELTSPRQDCGYVTISKIMEGSPLAKNTNIQVGMAIIFVHGKSCRWKSAARVAEMLDTVIGRAPIVTSFLDGNLVHTMLDDTVRSGYNSRRVRHLPRRLWRRTSSIRGRAVRSSTKQQQMSN